MGTRDDLKLRNRTRLQKSAEGRNCHHMFENTGRIWKNSKEGWGVEVPSEVFMAPAMKH